MNAPIAGETIFVIRSYPDLVEAFRTVKARLGLSNAWVDEVCGWCEGIADKKLGPSQAKPIGPIDFSTFCQIFAVQLEMRIDTAAAEQMKGMWEGRAERNVRKIESRISKTIIERAKPHVLREIGRKGGLKRSSQLSAKHARQKGGKRRMRKLSKKERVALSRMANESRWKGREVSAVAAPDAKASRSQHASPSPG